MPELLIPYLIGVVATLITLVIAGGVFVWSYLRAEEVSRREARLPLATRYADLSERIADLEEQHGELAESLDAAKQLIDEADEARVWLEQNREEVRQMRLERNELEQVRQEYVQLQEQLAEARESLANVDREKQKVEFEHEQLQQRVKDLAQTLQEQDDRMNRERAYVEKLREQAELATRELSEARKQLGDAKQAAAEAQRRLEAFEKELKDLEKARGEAATRMQNLADQVEELEAQKSELTAVTRGQAKKAEELKSRNDELFSEQMKRDKTLMPIEEALSELWIPAIAVEEFSKSHDSLEEYDALENAADYLKALGLRFPQRILNAFHTSLKTARETPLLVLAGISGTGKSLLPRRYAEAMGIQFLNIPVQPRWDGPQDLLGFFNYLEGRYKSTELTRALLQMDPYDRAWIPRSKKISHAADRMLLVLLDEMNLARIEYYFSEFLSRLETRRDIDPEIEIDRAKAEITLDVGRFEQKARVYVHTNVLFVGTMNEDESTLTLSDKVIDRANVMRFGRPKTLAASNGEPSDPDEFRAKDYLSNSNWEEWIENGEANELGEDVGDWITRFNEALMRVGRPFGYRTRNAIRSYVQQYPDRSDAGIRYALSDQLEQRVLPKLRGVDVDDDAGQSAVHDISVIARELEDPALEESIERGRRSHGTHLFSWMGVERGDESE